MALVLGGGEACKFLAFTNGTTPAVGTTTLLEITQQVQTDINRNDDNTYTITIDHAQDESAVYNFIEGAIDNTSTADTEELVYEAGTKVTSTSTATAYTLVVKGGVVTGGTDAGKRKCWAGAVTVGKTSGSYSQAANTYTRPTMECTSIAASGTVTIACTLLTGYATTPATLTIPATLKYGKVFFM